MIKTIIFDLGGVVLTNDWSRDYHEFLKEFSQAFSVTVNDLHRGWKAHYQFFEGGKTEEEFWNIFFKKSRVKEIDIEKAKIIWRKHQKSLENILDLIKKLKNIYKLVALTNISREWIDYKIEKFKLYDFFDLIISSGYAGINKPDPLAYKNILAKLEETPGNCLYIDDREENLKPARDLGMKTILFTNQKNLEEKLRKLEINF